jgi:UDP-glucose 4-epimerase
MDVTVTGGAGFIGSALVTRLVADGHDVTVFDNVSRGDVDKLDDVIDDIQFVRGDIRNKSEFADGIGNPDVLYHLAAINGTKNFYEQPNVVLDTNVMGVKHAVELTAEKEIPRLVFSSSSEVYGFPDEFPTAETHPLQIMDPENPRFSYAGSKIIGEQYVVNGAEAHGFDYTIVRPHNIYGPAMGFDHVVPEFIEQIVTDKPFTIYGDGGQTRSFCYIDDATDAFASAGVESAAANETFNVGTQEEVSINELAERLFDIADVDPEVEYTDSVELEGSTRRRQPSISNAREKIGYNPTVSLDEGLRRTFDWYESAFSERE